MNTPLRPHTHIDAGQIIAIAVEVVAFLFSTLGICTAGVGLWIFVLMQAEVAPSESPQPPQPPFETFTI